MSFVAGGEVSAQSLLFKLLYILPLLEYRTRRQLMRRQLMHHILLELVLRNDETVGDTPASRYVRIGAGDEF